MRTKLQIVGSERLQSCCSKSASGSDGKCFHRALHQLHCKASKASGGGKGCRATDATSFARKNASKGLQKFSNQRKGAKARKQ